MEGVGVVRVAEGGLTPELIAGSSMHMSIQPDPLCGAVRRCAGIFFSFASCHPTHHHSMH